MDLKIKLPVQGYRFPQTLRRGWRESQPKECVNFLSYAKGSCGELRTQIYIGIDIGYVPDEKGKRWIKETREISAMLVGLIRSKRNSA